ncbi:MAG: hypothetical protein WD030_02580, partial [Pirellulales bacterium]
FGEMVCYHPPAIEAVPITQAIHQLRCVDPNGPAVLAARSLGISFGDLPADHVFVHQDWTCEAEQKIDAAQRAIERELCEA